VREAVILEGSFTRHLKRKLEAHPLLKSAVVWKHADRFSAGIPDLSVSIGARTIWFEIKVKPRELTKLQRYYLARLNSGASLIIAEHNGKSASLTVGEYVSPRLLMDGLVECIVRRCCDV